MGRFVALFLSTVVVLAVQAPTLALAQSDSGEIRIVVTDAANKQPVGLARVLLDGAVITSELTGVDGQVHFTDVPDGIYRARILKRGYSSLTSASFEVLGGRLVTVTVALVADVGNLKVIGTVSVKASATISNSSINENSPQRRLSDDLAGALNKLSGVSVSTSGDDNAATQTVSLEGHDASQTQLTLDGIPLNAPGSAGNLAGYATDLFSGAAVHQGQQLGAAAGSVNFATLSPTISWLSAAALSAGSNGRYNYSFAESGSFDKLGIAAQTVYRESTSLVDGDFYLDTSGLAYSHSGDSAISGNLLKLRYQFGDSQTLTGTFLSSARDTGLVCLRYNGSLPCGYGPNNSADGSVQLYALTDNALLGATQVQASVYSSTTANLLDQTNRFVDGVAAPTGYSGLAQSQGFTINATLPAKERHTVSIQAYGTNSLQSTTPLVTQAQPYYNGSSQTNYSALQITDTVHSNDKLTLSETAGASAGTGSAGATAIASIGATWRPTSVDTFSGSYALGGVAATAGRAQILTDPASLRFDCNGKVAYGNAPGEQPGPSSSNSARLGYTRSLRGGSLTFTLYHQVQNGVLLPVYVNGATLASLGQLPATYVAQARALYESPAGCNASSGAVFGAQNLYFTTPVSGVQRTYEGGSLSGYLTVGNLVVEPYYNLTVAKANSGSYLFDNPYAITIPGAQLPNVPLQKAGIVFDYKAPHSILEWLADAQYTSKNNPNNLPAYTTFDAGVTAQLATGTLTFAASNITNTYAGIFAGPANAVPYTTLGGTLVDTQARPLAPRSYSATYAVKFGPGATSTQTGSNFRLPRVGGGPPDEGPAGPPGAPPPGGGTGAGGGLRNLFSALPTAPPLDPFALANDPQRCGRDETPKAAQVSSELKSFVATVEAAKNTRGEYPASVTLPLLADATLTYHGLGQAYAVTITPKGAGSLRALAGCLNVHVARSTDVTERKLYASTSPVFFVPQLNFMPAVGLYFVARQQQAGQEQFRLYTLPAAPPANPFEVRTAATCVGEVRNLATQSLTDLRAYFATGAKPASWTITAHASKSGAWYELAPGDPTAVSALLMCGRVAAATADQLAQRGFDGSAVPEMNYAPPLGLYIVRPNRAQPPGP